MVRLASIVGADEIGWYLSFNDLNRFASGITREAQRAWLYILSM
jgi:hypothetical protein